MTYKKIVEGLVEREAVRWLESFVEDRERGVWANGVTFEQESSAFTWQVDITVQSEKWRDYMGCERKFIVGGAIGDTGNYPSVIWEVKGSKKEYVWAKCEETRRALRISGEFKI